MNLLEVLKDCMLSTPPKLIHFAYKDAKGKTSSRVAEPYEVKGDTLFAWCIQAQAIRQFKTHSITSPRAGESFTPRMPIVNILPTAL